MEANEITEDMDFSAWELYEDSAEEEALKSLRAMVDGGTLKMPTNIHKCQEIFNASDPNFDQAKCDAFEFPMTSTKHFQLLTIKDLGPYAGKPGRWVARADDGKSYCMGRPSALLGRLLEYTHS